METEKLILDACCGSRMFWFVYHIKTSWCKMCVSEDNQERNKRKENK